MKPIVSSLPACPGHSLRIARIVQFCSLNNTWNLAPRHTPCAAELVSRQIRALFRREQYHPESLGWTTISLTVNSTMMHPRCGELCTLYGLEDQHFRPARDGWGCWAGEPCAATHEARTLTLGRLCNQPVKGPVGEFPPSLATVFYPANSPPLSRLLRALSRVRTALGRRHSFTPHSLSCSRKERSFTFCAHYDDLTQVAQLIDCWGCCPLRLFSCAVCQRSQQRRCG